MSQTKGTPMKHPWDRVCVVGGAGFIGSNLCLALAGEGVRLRIVDDFSTGKRENLAGVAGKPHVEILEGDITDREVCRAAVKDMQIVLDLACLGVRHSIPRPERNFQVNGNGTLNLLVAARDANVQRFLYISSSEAYGTALRVPMDEDHPTYPMTVYGAGKLAGEALTRAFHRTYGLPAGIVRPFNTYGPHSHYEGDSGEVIPRFIVRVMNGQPPVIFGDPTNARDFTHVSDTVRGILDAADCDQMVGQTLNIGYGEPRTVAEVAAIVLKAAGREDLKPVMERPRPGDVHLHYADTTKAQRMIGWKATIPLDEGIPMLIDYWRRMGADFAKMFERDKLFNWEE
jgi:UDP-glucose 4-epimerase